MQGSIITRQKCGECGKDLVHDEKRKGCFCKDHPHIAATAFIVRFPGDIYQNHKSYDSAVQILNYLRYEKGSRSGKFNSDDYRSAKPNSFVVLAKKYLERKKSRASYKKIERYISLAANHFGDRILREITAGDIDDYLRSIPGIGDKTRANYQSQLHDFWKWAYERGGIITLAEFPAFHKIEYELGWRNVTTWENQELVIAKIKERTYRFNPKIWLAVDMLATYTELRPEDIRRIKEGDFVDGYVTIHKPTKKRNKFKTIKLHPDHVKEWGAIKKKFPAASPDLPFFRHVTTMSNRIAGTKWGINYLKEQWDAARDEVGLAKSISLYNGTKHTTATETAKLLGSKKAQEASGLTNKAFERYNQAITDGAYQVVIKIRKAKKKADVIPLRNQKTKTE